MVEQTTETRQRTMVGRVISNKMDKTIVIQTEHHVKHRLYKKIIKRFRRIHAHDPENQCNIGDTVRIGETRPISKTKAWALLDIVERAR